MKECSCHFSLSTSFNHCSKEHFLFIKIHIRILPPIKLDASLHPCQKKRGGERVGKNLINMCREKRKRGQTSKEYVCVPGHLPRAAAISPALLSKVFYSVWASVKCGRSSHYFFGISIFRVYIVKKGWMFRYHSLPDKKFEISV